MSKMQGIVRRLFIGAMLFAVGVGVFSSPASATSVSGHAETAQGNAIQWVSIGSVGSLRYEISMVDPHGSVVHVVQLEGWLDADSGQQGYRFEIDGLSVTVDPSDEMQALEFAEFLDRQVDSGLAYWIKDALSALPSGSGVRYGLAALGDALERVGEGDVVSPADWGDCYQSCMKEKKKDCNDECGSRSPFNICNSLCYIGSGLGCSVGCVGSNQQVEKIEQESEYEDDCDPWEDSCTCTLGIGTCGPGL